MPDAEMSRRSFLKAAALGAVAAVAGPRSLPDPDPALLRAHTSAWIEQEIAQAVLTARENQLADFGGQAVFDRPVVRVADGDDELFKQFRDVVSSQHLMPRDVLRRFGKPDGDADEVRVIVWALPLTAAVRQSNTGPRWPSELYNAAWARGKWVNFRLERRLTRMLHAQGWTAVVPAATEAYAVFRDPGRTISSSWSERHVAYVAGMGQFGLRGCLITPVGVNVHLGSVVTTGPIQTSPRPYTNYAAPCLEQHGEGCGACIHKCPEGAISRDGLDKLKCLKMLRASKEHLQQAHPESARPARAPAAGSNRADEEYSLGCGLCMCGVPCEAGIPGAPAAQKPAGA